MVKIIHITDTHILPKSEKLMGLDPAARLQSVIASVNKDHADADFAVFSGDLTDKGDIESYRLFADLLDGLRVPYTLTLGNHDNRSAFVKVFGREWLDHSGHIVLLEWLAGLQAAQMTDCTVFSKAELNARRLTSASLLGCTALQGAHDASQPTGCDENF